MINRFFLCKKTISSMVLLLIAGLFACNSNPRPKEGEPVHIVYTDDINGYQVNAWWMPSRVIAEHVVGPAIMHFFRLSDSTEFTLTNNNFALLKERLKAIYSDGGIELTRLDEQEIFLSYQQYQSLPDRFGTTQEPFFFEDIDFDKKAELLITEVGSGQRGIATFKAYRIGEGQMPVYNTITWQEPFVSLDELSRVNGRDKTLTIHHTAGTCWGRDEIYRLQQAPDAYEENRFVLEKIIEERKDDATGQCMELTYEVKNMTQRKLVSQRVIDP
jgi:hypothetical protein